ncbi:OmpH family outer membrane protein [Marinimicrobium sp. ABcell2]|uniref:OmpH family outer membrane protein n=1 Tax=Marinimicrobium sp. ABcell2 TaxID=3069751 RepID=UPI0027AEE833|nr:OmpH family outer membrane protein [Marinimicrobium sp. ABcell2]MDQ2075333.1 OmpH family outer membrane protein [Marinimicrobium sp. ABcell2]
MITSTAKKLIVGMALMMASSLALAEGKIVILDLQAAVLSTNVAQARLGQLEQNPEYAALMARYESLTEDLQRLQRDAEQNAMTWSEEDRKKKEEEARKLRQEYETAVQTLQNGRQQVMQNVMQQMGASTRDVLESLIEADKIGLILSSQAVYHATEHYDITDRVTQLLNQRSQQQ